MHMRQAKAGNEGWYVSGRLVEGRDSTILHVSLAAGFVVGST
jgi:hypothetical protein